MMKSILLLVTGGTGLVGKNIVRHLLSAGYRVRVLTRKTSLFSTGSIEYIQGDIVSGKNLEKALSGCNGVFHCAGEKNLEAKMYYANVVGTANIFEAVKTAGICFFCHISSVGVTGRTRLQKVTEETPCNPMNFYETTKLKAEVIVRKGLPGGYVVILRPTNIFGRSIFQDFVHCSFKQKLRLWLRYNENAHLVFVEDVSAAAVFFWQNAKESGCDTYIVSSDEEAHNSIGEVDATLREFSGQQKRRLMITPPLFLPWFFRIIRHGESNKGNIIYSSQKLFSTGFTMPYGLRKGIRSICADFKK